MRRVAIAFLSWIAAAAEAGAAPLPDCAALVAPLQQDPSSIREAEPLLGVDAIVQDAASTDDVRICTGIGRYRSASAHITYTAKWQDEKRTRFSIAAHDTTEAEAAARARSLRTRFHPTGDGTFLIKNDPAYCTDPDFLRRATQELQWGISVDDAFYQEPDYTIFDMRANGDDTGIMANCVATVGNDKVKGEIFLGTNWEQGENGRRYEFYVLAAGPQNFRLKDRLWDMSAE